jgi:hypothetical protein
LWSRVVGVGHEDGSEVQPLPDVRGADARSAQIGRPNGVARTFQVSANSVEPREAVRACNLFAKDDWRAALADEPEPLGPQVAVVGNSGAATGHREGLTGTRAGPHGAVVRPPGEAEGVGPGAKSGEGVKLRGPHNVNWTEIAD